MWVTVLGAGAVLGADLTHSLPFPRDAKVWNGFSCAWGFIMYTARNTTEMAFCLSN